ncbi:MAG: class II fumarate hydratase [Pseudomonadota bacterium]
MTETRTARDTLGEIEIPADALWDAQTQRAVLNFPVSGRGMPRPFIHALIEIKRCAAQTNSDLGTLPVVSAQTIIQACDQLLASEDVEQHFPVDVFQTGSGTSSNMNANEVIANLGKNISGNALSPNDDVNLGQSSNDVIPTSIQVSCAMLLVDKLIPALRYLSDSINSKAASLDNVVKTGRTHLMDAMPVTMGQALRSWSSQIDYNIASLEQRLNWLTTLGIGGTAVGTGINSHPEFSSGICSHLSKRTGIDFRPADNPFAHIGSQDTSLALSGDLKTVAASIMKIANDLRWMNSGPLAGLGEIELEALQPGSSIMPGKVNPVIPESAAMVAAQVMGNDTAVTVGAQSGNFELNVMLPMIGNNLVESLLLLTNISRLLADKAITSFNVNEDNISAALGKNPILVTALNPIIGYESAAKIAKTAYAEKRPVMEVAIEMSGLPEDQLKDLLDPTKLTDNNTG